MYKINSDFFLYPEFKVAQTKRVLLLQVDIEGHSALSREKRPADVMTMKVELAEALCERLSTDGFKGVGWQGDGGMFALDVSDNAELVDKVVSAWRHVRHAAEQTSKSYQHLLADGLIPLRASAHVCNVYVHPDPRYWHAEGINDFAKQERAMGIRNSLVITGDLYRELPEPTKHEFQMVDVQVKVGASDDVYRFAAGIPGDRNMDFIEGEMRSIAREVRSFRSTVEASGFKKKAGKRNSTPLLIVVDLQQDFSRDRPLAVADAEPVAAATYQLTQDALKAGVDVIVARDWHPDDHFSFRLWPKHCVASTEGAAFMPEFHFEKLKGKVLVADIGVDNGRPDYNPYFDAGLGESMADRAPSAIYVTGIALEYCVLATCLASLAYSSSVIALETYIRSAKSDKAGVAWKLMEEGGVRRQLGNPFKT